MYQSTKILDGFSTCFRQWRAAETHCSQLHGYAIKFELVFQSTSLDHRNWVVDFGIFSRSDFSLEGLTIKEWFKYTFDHTVLVASDDPYLGDFFDLANSGIAAVRVLPKVGCEMFAQLVFEVVSSMLKHDFKDSEHKPQLLSVKCIENEKNSAIYYG